MARKAMPRSYFQPITLQDFFNKFKNINYVNSDLNKLELWLKNYLYSLFEAQKQTLDENLAHNKSAILFPIIEQLEKLGLQLYAQNKNYLYDSNNEGLKILFQLAELIENTCYFRCFLYRADEKPYVFLSNYFAANHKTCAFYLRDSKQELYYFDGSKIQPISISKGTFAAIRPLFTTDFKQLADLADLHKLISHCNFLPINFQLLRLSKNPGEITTKDLVQCTGSKRTYALFEDKLYDIYEHGSFLQVPCEDVSELNDHFPIDHDISLAADANFLQVLLAKTGRSPLAPNRFLLLMPLLTTSKVGDTDLYDAKTKWCDAIPNRQGGFLDIKGYQQQLIQGSIQPLSIKDSLAVQDPPLDEQRMHQSVPTYFLHSVRMLQQQLQQNTIDPLRMFEAFFYFLELNQDKDRSKLFYYNKPGDWYLDYPRHAMKIASFDFNDVEAVVFLRFKEWLMSFDPALKKWFDNLQSTAKPIKIVAKIPDGSADGFYDCNYLFIDGESCSFIVSRIGRIQLLPSSFITRSQREQLAGLDEIPKNHELFDWLRILDNAALSMSEIISFLFSLKVPRIIVVDKKLNSELKDSLFSCYGTIFVVSPANIYRLEGSGEACVLNPFRQRIVKKMPDAEHSNGQTLYIKSHRTGLLRIDYWHNKKERVSVTLENNFYKEKIKCWIVHATMPVDDFIQRESSIYAGLDFHNNFIYYYYQQELFFLDKKKVVQLALRGGDSATKSIAAIFGEADNCAKEARPFALNTIYKNTVPAHAPNWQPPYKAQNCHDKIVNHLRKIRMLPRSVKKEGVQKFYRHLVRIYGEDLPKNRVFSLNWRAIRYWNRYFVPEQESLCHNLIIGHFKKILSNNKKNSPILPVASPCRKAAEKLCTLLAEKAKLAMQRSFTEFAPELLWKQDALQTVSWVFPNIKTVEVLNSLLDAVFAEKIKFPQPEVFDRNLLLEIDFDYHDEKLAKNLIDYACSEPPKNLKHCIFHLCFGKAVVNKETIDSFCRKEDILCLLNVIHDYPDIEEALLPTIKELMQQLTLEEYKPVLATKAANKITKISYPGISRLLYASSKPWPDLLEVLSLLDRNCHKLFFMELKLEQWFKQNPLVNPALFTQKILTQYSPYLFGIIINNKDYLKKFIKVIINNYEQLTQYYNSLSDANRALLVRGLISCGHLSFLLDKDSDLEDLLIEKLVHLPEQYDGIIYEVLCFLNKLREATIFEPFNQLDYLLKNEHSFKFILPHIYCFKSWSLLTKLPNFTKHCQENSFALYVKGIISNLIRINSNFSSLLQSVAIDKSDLRKEVTG